MPTGNHHLATPARRELDWDVPLVQNFEAIDNKLIIRDIAANQPNYAPAGGALFLATDTRELSLGDGSAWQLLGVLAVGDAASLTVSGDGTTTTFSLSHNLGVAPTIATVTPTSEDASTDFWVSNKTSTAVEITYAAAPPTGTDNLTYDLEVR